MKLNVGCGRKPLQGWVNADAAPGEGVDLVCYATEIPLEEGVVSELMAIHLLEHLYPWDGDAAIGEFMRVLRPGGVLVLELPDFLKCCRNVADMVQHEKHPDMLGLFGLFGDPRERDPLMIHKWGYTPATLRSLLRSHGFVSVREEAPVFHAAGRLRRDMRLVCSKPEM